MKKIDWGKLKRQQEESQVEKASLEELINEMSDEEICRVIQKESVSPNPDDARRDIATVILVDRHIAMLGENEELLKENRKLSDDIYILKQEKEHTENEYKKIKDRWDALKFEFEDTDKEKETRDFIKQLKSWRPRM